MTLSKVRVRKAWAKPYAKRRVRNTERQEQMCALYKDGRTLQQIGELYGVSRERVRQIVVAAGVMRTDGGVSIRKVNRQRFLEMNRKALRDQRCKRTYGCTHDFLMQENDGAPVSRVGSIAQLFIRQKVSARHRKIPWRISFPEWISVWKQSGHLDERGRGGDRYVMARFGDLGAYEIGNVYICTCSQNVADYQAELKRRGVECPDGYKRLPERASAFFNNNTDDAQSAAFNAETND